MKLKKYIYYFFLINIHKEIMWFHFFKKLFNKQIVEKNLNK